RIGDDRFIPGLRRLVETVREQSAGHTRLFIQILDFLTVRRRPEPATFFARYLPISSPLRERLARALADERWLTAARAAGRARRAAAERSLVEAVLDERELESLDYGYRERVWDTHLPWIRDLPRVLPALFAAAAGRARDAGFDGVELHYAHAYTMASFLSRLNDRADGYGGSREQRVRVPLEALAAVRRSVGDEYVVGIRFLGDDVVAGGSRIDDAMFYGVELAAAGANYLSVSKGGRFEDARQPKIGEAVYPYTGASGYECMPTVLGDERGPFGRNVPLAAATRRAVREAGRETPAVPSGAIHSFAKAGAAGLAAAHLVLTAQPNVVGHSPPNRSITCTRVRVVWPEVLETSRKHGDSVLSRRVSRWHHHCPIEGRQWLTTSSRPRFTLDRVTLQRTSPSVIAGTS